MNHYLKPFDTLFSTINNTIHSNVFLDQHRTCPKAFTRSRKMPFPELLKFIMNLPQKSLPSELDTFFAQENILLNSKNKSPVTKQSFSEQRQYISPSAFYELLKLSADIGMDFLPENLWHGHKLLAVDGTTLQIPATTENCDYFGTNNSNEFPLPLANASSLYDVLNDVIIDANIDKYGTSERIMIEKFISNYKHKDNEKAPVILLDRGYPSRQLTRSLMDNNFFFMMRCTTKYITSVVNAELGDHFVRDTFHGFPMLLRVIKFTLPSGIIETLITNLYTSEYSTEELKALYSMRWKIETKYCESKSRLLIENFSGKKPIIIKQDFYATLLFSNITAIFKCISDSYIIEDIEKKTLKNRYQANRNYLIGLISEYLLQLLHLSKRRKWMLIKNILERSIKIRSEVRPNRTSERRVKHDRVKHTTTYKSNI